MRSAKWSTVGAALALLTWCSGSGQAAPISPGCLPNPLPAEPVPPAVALDTDSFGERMRVDIWRQPCLDGSGTALLMRAAPSTAAPLLCSGDFTLRQGGLRYNAVLASAPAGPRVCGDLNAPTTIVVDAAAGPPIGFDGGQAFTLVFAGWVGGPTTLEVGLGPAGDVPVTLAAAVLPGSRSVQAGAPLPATAFAALAASGAADAVDCRVAPATSIPATFEFRTTDPTTNAVTGGPNASTSIPRGRVGTFLLAFTPYGTFPPTVVQLSFDCANSPPAPIVQGVNTLLLSADAGPVPDLVALVATASGDGIVDVPGATGTGAFAVSAANVGSGGAITVSADTGGAALPVSLSLCRTDPQSGGCVSDLGPAVRVPMVDHGDTLTFSVFARGHAPVPFDPAAHRVFVRFQDDADVTRGTTSVAIRTR